MTPLPKVGNRQDDTPFPGEIIRNLSILTQEFDRFGLAPQFGKVGDHSRLQSMEFGTQTPPIRGQNCSQVAIRKQNGAYHPYVDGVKSSDPTKAVIHCYRGEDVDVTIRQRGTGANPTTYRSRRGFLDSATSQRLIGPLSIAVIVEDGQSPPDKVEVRVWQETVSNGSTDSHRLTGLVDLGATELASDGEMKCLNVPFPATFIHPPYVEIRDTDVKMKQDVKQMSSLMTKFLGYTTALATTLCFNPQALVKFLPFALMGTATFAEKVGAYFSYLWSTSYGVFQFIVPDALRTAVGGDPLAQQTAQQTAENLYAMKAVASAIGPDYFVRAISQLKPVEIWALNTVVGQDSTKFTYNSEGAIEASVLGSESFIPDFTQYDKTEQTFDVVGLEALKTAANLKVKKIFMEGMTAALSFPMTLDRSPRVRMTLSQLADALTRIADKAGPGMILELEDYKIPRRERVLRRFLASHDRVISVLQLKELYRKYHLDWSSGKPDEKTTTERNQADDWLTRIPRDLITDGLRFDLLSKTQTRLMYEVVISDPRVGRAPTKVTVSAEEKVGLQAGWQCAGVPDDIRALKRSLDSFTEKLTLGEQEERGAGPTKDSWTGFLYKDGDRKSWARYLLKEGPITNAAQWYLGAGDTTRRNMLNHASRLREPLLDPDGPFQTLRKRMEDIKPDGQVILNGRVQLRVFPQRARITYSSLNIKSSLDDDKSGSTNMNDADNGVVTSTPVKETVKSTARYRTAVQLLLRRISGDWERHSNSRLVFGIFVVPASVRSGPIPPLPALLTIDETHPAFSPVRTTPPFEISDAEQTERLSVQVQERIRLMRMPRVNSSAAKMAVADELIYRIVNRCAQSANLPPIASITEGARSNALSCVSSVTSTLLLSVTKDLPLDKNDVLFHCLKGARGAWVLLRAAQVWDRQIGRAYGQVAHSDGATEEGRFAILPPSEEERIKELAHLYKQELSKPLDEIAKIPVAALQHTLSSHPRSNDTIAAVDLKLAESVASFDRVAAFVRGMQLRESGRHHVLVAISAMRPTLLCQYGHEPQFHHLQSKIARFNERLRRAQALYPNMQLGPPPKPSFEDRQRRADSLKVDELNDGGFMTTTSVGTPLSFTSTTLPRPPRETPHIRICDPLHLRLRANRRFYVPYSYWVGALVSPQSTRTIDTIPVWVDRIRESIQGTDCTCLPPNENEERAGGTIKESSEAYLIHLEALNNIHATVKPRFARFYRDSFEADGFRQSGFATYVAGKLKAEEDGSLKPDDTTSTAQSIASMVEDSYLSCVRLNPVITASASFGHKEVTPTGVPFVPSTALVNSASQTLGLVGFMEATQQQQVGFNGSKAGYQSNPASDPDKKPYYAIQELVYEQTAANMMADADPHGFLNRQTAEATLYIFRGVSDMITEYLGINSRPSNALRVERALTPWSDSRGNNWGNLASSGIRWEDFSAQELGKMKTFVDEVTFEECQDVTTLLNATLQDHVSYWIENTAPRGILTFYRPDAKFISYFLSLSDADGRACEPNLCKNAVALQSKRIWAFEEARARHLTCLARITADDKAERDKAKEKKARRDKANEEKARSDKANEEKARRDKAYIWGASRGAMQVEGAGLVYRSIRNWANKQRAKRAAERAAEPAAERAAKRIQRYVRVRLDARRIIEDRLALIFVKQLRKAVEERRQANREAELLKERRLYTEQMLREIMEELQRRAKRGGIGLDQEDPRGVAQDASYQKRSAESLPDAIRAIKNTSSGSLATRAGVLLWNCERIVQSCLLMNPGGDIPSLVDVFFPYRVKAATVVPDKYALKRVRFRLGWTLREYVGHHFKWIGGGSEFKGRPNVPSGAPGVPVAAAAAVNTGGKSLIDANINEASEMKQMIEGMFKGATPPDPDTAGSTTASSILFNHLAYKQREYKYWHPDHFSDPRMSSIDDVLQYARQVESIQGSKPEDDKRLGGRVKELLDFYRCDNSIAALALRHDPQTWLIQLKNNYVAAEINEANERVFIASVVLAGAILSCITTQPRFRLRKSEEPVGPTPDAVYMGGLTSFLFQGPGLETTESVNSKYNAYYQDTVPGNGCTIDVFCESIGIDQADPSANPLHSYVSGHLSRQAGKTVFDTNDAKKTTWGAELEPSSENATGILDRMFDACFSTRPTASALTLAELALVCVAW